MTTTKQIKANQKNALKGGVKTEEGKNISRTNATKYGFFSKIVTEYDKLENEEFCSDMYKHFEPQDMYQAQLLEILLSQMLTYRRICLIEKEYIQAELEDDTSRMFQIGGYTPIIRAKVIEPLEKFQKYKTSLQNNICKLQHEMERLQHNNNSDGAKSVPNIVDVNISSSNGFVLESE